MIELTINGRKQKFYSFTQIYRWLLANKNSMMPENFNRHIDDSLKLLKSINYDKDFRNYYENLLNSLKIMDKSLG